MKTTPESAFAFNPEKNVDAAGGGGFTNAARADRGEEMIQHCPDYSEDDKATAIQDAISDLFHLCDREGLDVDEVIQSAKMNWIAER